MDKCPHTARRRRRVAIQGFDTLKGEPASFYRNADPGSN
jgi:hypothetical protein